MKCKTNAATERDVMSGSACCGTGHAADTVPECSQDTREEFQRDIKTRLDELDAKIDELRETRNSLKDTAGANLDRKIAALKAQREAVGVKLAEVGHSSAEAWDNVRKGVTSAYDALSKSLRDAWKEFSKR